MSEVNAAEIGRQYAAAHRLHHAAGNLGAALQQYTALISAHANAPEAGYARSQVLLMLRAVVPREELLEAHVALLRGYLERKSEVEVDVDDKETLRDRAL